MGELVVAVIKRQHLRSTVFAYPTTDEIMAVLPHVDGYGLLAIERRNHGKRRLTKCILINSYQNCSYEATYVETPDYIGWTLATEGRIDEQLRYLQAARNYITFVMLDCALLTEAICCRIGSFITTGATILERDADGVVVEQRRLLAKELNKLAKFSLGEYVECDKQSDSYTRLNNFFRAEAYRFHLACFDKDFHSDIGYDIYDEILHSDMMRSD